MYKQIIKKWIEEVTTKNTWPDHDLHIDCIDSSLRENPALWFKKGLEYFFVANNILKGSPYCVILSIGLKSSQAERDATDINIDSILAIELSYTPPSMYIYAVGSPRYRHMLENLLPLQETTEAAYFLSQWKSEDGYNSSIFVIA